VPLKEAVGKDYEISKSEVRILPMFDWIEARKIKFENPDLTNE